MEKYWQRFVSHVYSHLGGLDMAEDFFLKHPEARMSLRRSCKYHFGKQGASWKAAKIFFERTLLPIIRREHAQATKRPIPRKRK